MADYSFNLQFINFIELIVIKKYTNFYVKVALIKYNLLVMIDFGFLFDLKWHFEIITANLKYFYSL